ncbi:MAG: hypothetical protein ACRDZR_01205 [Acidimicrobiales bacterium]
MPDGHEIVIPAPARMLTTNAERRLHWSQRAEIVRLWRVAAWAGAVAARPGLAALSAAEIDAYPVQRGGVLADPGAHAPIVKAAVDGLVDAKVLPDDSPTFLRALRIHPPVRGAAALVLVVTEAPS